MYNKGFLNGFFSAVIVSVVMAYYFNPKDLKKEDFNIENCTIVMSDSGKVNGISARNTLIYSDTFTENMSITNNYFKNGGFHHSHQIETTDWRMFFYAKIDSIIMGQ